MQINTINIINYQNFCKQSKQKKCSVKNPSGSFVTKSNCLNQIYFEGRNISANKLLERMGEESFPSAEIVEKLKIIGNKKDYSLYDIHIEHYKNLLNCKTLDEAKELYPEFKDVIDAKDIDLSKIATQNSFKKIADGKIEGASIRDLSLELLKRQYGKLYSTHEKEKYFNLSHTSIWSIYDLLNIKKLNPNYIKAVSKSTPESIEKSSKIFKAMWEQDDGTFLERARNTALTVLQEPEVRSKLQDIYKSPKYRELMSQISSNGWAKDDGSRRQKQREIAINILGSPEIKKKSIESARTAECRKKVSRIQKEVWAKDDGSRRQKQREIALEVFNTPEAKKKQYEATHTREYFERQAQIMKDRYENHPEYRSAQKLAWERHPEIRLQMAKIASHYPMLHYIIDKKEKKQRMTAGEQKLLNTYYKECEKKIKDLYKTIGAEYHKILVEWGIARGEQV